jgi:hypothetical protein
MLQKLERVLSPSKLNKDGPRRSCDDPVEIGDKVTIDYAANPQWKRGQLCWEPKGPVAVQYNDLAPKLLQELNKSRRESSREVSISLFMVGRTAAHAKPILIISGEEKQSRKEAKSQIIRSQLLANSGFEIGLLRYPPAGPTIPVAMDDHTLHSPLASHATYTEVYFDPEDQWRSTGLQIYIKTGPDTFRKATANAVYNGEEYGYATAAHAFQKPLPPVATTEDDDSDLDMPFNSDSDSDSDIDSESNSDSDSDGDNNGDSDSNTDSDGETRDDDNVDNDTDDDDDDDEYYREVRFVDRHIAAGSISRGSITSSSEKSCGYLPTAAKALPLDEASRLVKKTDITKTSTASIPNKVSKLQPLGHIS